MEQEREETACVIWVNRELRIISFHQADGFEEYPFTSREELFQFAVQKEAEGFGIQ